MSRRCVICGGGHEVGRDGRCAGCRIAKVAAVLGIRYDQARALPPDKYPPLPPVPETVAARCGFCGTLLGDRRAGTKYCSPVCAERARSARRKRPPSYANNPARACPVCGEDISWRRSNALYCSKRCRDAAERLRRREAKANG